MPAWKILLTDGLEENGQAILRTSAEVVNLPTITSDELLNIISEFDAMIVRGRTKVTPAVFSAGKKLRVVGRAGVGVDNIDLDAARQQQVTVVNSPLATTVSVAELTLGLMLSVMRQIPHADTTMKTGKWAKKEFEGGELYQKTLGVIGYGRIGAAVGKRAAAFGMSILGYDPLIKPEIIKDLGGEPVSLDELYARADVITLHTPLTNETRGSLNAKVFAQMKQGVVLICAARGGIIDEADLVTSLNSGQVGGAGLDVFATEPPGATALITHPRVVVTPHIGAQTVEAQRRAADDIAHEVLTALKGDPLHWKVA